MIAKALKNVKVWYKMKGVSGSNKYFERIESIIKDGRRIDAFEFFNLVLDWINTDGYIDGYEVARKDGIKAIKKMNRGI